MSHLSQRGLRNVGSIALAIVASGAAVIGSHQSAPPVSAGQAVQAPPDPATCKGLLGQPDRLPAVLAGVERYGSSYVLVVPQRLAQRIPKPEAPALKEVEVGVQAGSPAADAARAMGLTRLREYPADRPGAIRALQDLKGGTLDTAIVWAPLAGLAFIELDIAGQVAAFTVDRPRPAPAALRGTAVAHPCAAAIADELVVDGVLPAELLVSVDIQSLLTRQAPAFSLEAARSGAAVYAEACSKCHGPDAVADPKGLAPVDLRISVGRFTFPGFSFIVLNGRPERSMPPLRGTVTDDQIALVYQYLKARSKKLLPSSRP